MFRVAAPGAFTIEAKANVASVPDMNLLVFNATGYLIAGDDDNDSSCTVLTSLNTFDSCLTLTLAAGDYCVAVGTTNIGAFVNAADVASDSYFGDDDSGILASPSAQAIGLVASEDALGDDQGNYTMNFSSATGAVSPVVASGASIPTLSAWGMSALSSLLAAVSIVALRRQRG